MIIKLMVVVELSRKEERFIDKDSLIKDLVGEVVTVKSGRYENSIVGNISDAVIDNTEETR